MKNKFSRKSISKINRKNIKQTQYKKYHKLLYVKNEINILEF